VKNDHRGCKVALERIFDYDNVKRRENCESKDLLPPRACCRSRHYHHDRAFARGLLERLPLDTNSDDFVFDNQVLAQVIASGCAIGEVTCPARYLPEASSINFRRSVRYGLGRLFTALRFRFARWGLARPIA
jgi:hypothetical protein